MASNVEIANLALSRVGGSRIAALSDSSKEARAVNAIFTLIREEVLEERAWSFATERAALSQSSTTPDFGYSYAYLLPVDCLRPLDLFDEDADYAVEGRLLLTDESSANLRYIKRVTDPTQLTPGFVRAFSFRLAIELAMAVAQDLNLQESLENKWEGVLSSAAVLDAASQDVIPASVSTYVDARG